MPGPDQRELPPFYMAEEDVVMQIGRDRLQRMASRSLHEIVRETHPSPAPEAWLAAKLEDIVARLRRVEAELCGHEMDGVKYNVEKKGAIWTASKP